MFIGREAELQALDKQFSSSKRTAVLVYGKRRVGKSTLISRAAKGFKGAVVEHLCIQSSYRGNLDALCRNVCKTLDLPQLRFDHIQDLFEFLAQRKEPILLVIDEYQYFKESRPKAEVDSLFQAVIDSLPAHIKLVLCGSYVTIMRELLEESNPLFGRFTSVLHLEEFDYLEAAQALPDMKPYDKAMYYGLFGGSPYVLSVLDYTATPAENLVRLLLPETGLLRIHTESIMLKEIQRAFDVRILEALGNGKKRYSELHSIVADQSNGLLDKQLKNLMNMETIRKVSPINRRNDKKKQFYEISDNLMRLYFAYVFGNSAMLANLGEEAFFRNEIEPSLVHFASRRFEEIVMQYFRRQARAGRLDGVRDFGSYWYDDPVAKANGEFDCVLVREDVLDFYECKYFDRPMTLAECKLEEEQIRKTPGANIGAIGFVCVGGFDFKKSEYALVTGNDLYKQR